jgi:hypothetical protein
MPEISLSAPVSEHADKTSKKADSIPETMIPEMPPKAILKIIFFI